MRLNDLDIAVYQQTRFTSAYTSSLLDVAALSDQDDDRDHNHDHDHEDEE